MSAVLNYLTRDETFAHAPLCDDEDVRARFIQY